MLSNVITSIRMRYAFAGAAFGSVFTSCALAYDAAFVNPQIQSLTGLVQNNPAHVAMALMPAILGFTFYKVGESRTKLVEELERRETAERSLEHNAFHDSLTGLKNRHALERDVAALIARGIDGDSRPAMMLLDLDKFKFINDTMGHNVGDEILLALSRRLVEAIGRRQTVYRLGGDEFVILWSGAPSSEVICEFCHALVKLISFPFELAKIRLTSGGSVGVTWIEDGDTSMSDALRRADLALYRAKEVPGSHFMLYDRAVAHEAEQRMQMESDLRLAIEEDRFFLEYQPIVHLATDRIKGFEALVRWRMGDRVIRPDMFIPIAEKSGLIIPLGKWVLTEACRQAVTWPDDIGISVNIAGEQFKDGDFVPFVRNLLETSGIAPQRVTLEVTESLFSVDVAVVRKSLTRLRELGVHLALDDFGTGFSSINHLRTFPIDTLKIDRSFTEMMLENEREAELVGVIMKLSKAFGMATTVEGVETHSQLDFIRRAGAGNVQGFLISRPVQEAMVPVLLREQSRLGGGTPEKIVHRLRA
ncbi:putative bifunctional diguanylate cyclase/phosphodiesterase [Pararhizobium haloflavum]|uniref:putative bifunctional diguanylate cyclase/phosphodiesterase n=1 Tax=Pararhizobium haloflavum TaxID=2037914 RepID=UPI0018E40CEA|nr:bifunctional diguanylate cyclase/phosphodiesterase [Pararhizobium haloflavum]